jgi:hypothetical protein
VNENEKPLEIIMDKSDIDPKTGEPKLYRGCPQ